MNTQTPLKRAKDSYLVLLTFIGLTACGGGDPSLQLPSATQAKAAQEPSTTQQGNLASVFESGPPGPSFPDAILTQKSPAQTTPKAFRLAQSGANGGYTVNPENREEARLFYNTIHQSSSGISTGWTGNIANCNAGDTSAEYKAATLRRINWFRAMAGVPAAIQFDEIFNVKAQQAAMLMSANSQLSHFPPSNWTCYNATAAEAAGKSNLNLGSSGTDAIADGYMRDPGASNSVVGHRRWILYPQTQLMGTGDAGGANLAAAPMTNALWVQDANIWNTRPAVRDDFVAWPTKGYTPYTAVYPRWSFSYPNADFSSATVSMTENGSAIATKLEATRNGFGENTLVWLPGTYVDGMTWAKPTSDMVYRVVVNNVIIAGQTRSFSYTSTVFDPQQGATGSAPATISGSASPVSGQTSAYTFSAAAGATDYQWRTVKLASLSLEDGAEADTANFSTATSAGYGVTTNAVFATGANSYHLAHTQPVDQTLQFKGVFVPGLASSLTFKSRLGLSAPAQIARVEASEDDGASWVSAFEQSGQQSGQTSNLGESAFSVKQISLAQFSNKTILLRFRYELSSGSYYPQASTGVGWYIDDIRLDGLEVVVSTGLPTTISTNGFDFMAEMAGPTMLQINSGMYGYYSAWTAAKRLMVTSPPITSNQIFTSTPGNDTFTGGNGLDTVVFSGNRSNYTVVKTTSGWSISSALDGTDTLGNVERLRFADTNVGLDTSSVGGQAYRVYQAAFNRAPDVNGLGFWIGRMDAGLTLRNVADGFVNSAEFKALYGANPTNAEIVAKFYSNVLHRPAEMDGFNFWVNVLNTRAETIAGVLAAFSESAENQNALIGVIGNGFTYTPFF